MTSAPISPSSRPANGPAIRVPNSSTRMPSSGPVGGHAARELVAHQPVGDDGDGLAQFVALIGPGVIVCGAVDFVHLLVGMADRLEQPPGVAGCAGVVGEVADHQRRHRDVAPALHPVAVRVVVAPLREPAAQRAEPGQPDRAHVHHLRIAQIAGSRNAFVGIDGRIEPPRVGHGAVHDEAELVVGAAGGFQFGQLVLDPGGDTAVAVDLGLPVAGQELLAVGRLVGVVRVVQVQFRIPLGRIGFVQDRPVHPLGQRAVPADVRGQQHDSVGGGQIELGEVGPVTRRARRDGRVLGLLLVEHRQRTAAAPAGQHHLLIAEPFLGVLDGGAEILDHLLHQQRRVGAAEPAVAVDDVVAGPGQRVDHRQVRAAADRVHEHQHGVRRVVLRLEQIAFQHDDLGEAAVDVADAGIVLEGNEIGDPVVVVLHGVLGLISAVLGRVPAPRLTGSVAGGCRWR